MPEYSTKIQIKPLPRFVRLLECGDGSFSPTYQKNEIIQAALRISPVDDGISTVFASMKFTK
jgi:hypothetical protein